MTKEKRPIILNRLNVDNKNFLDEKAKTKANGIYTLRGILYRVRDHKVLAYAVWGEVLQNCGATTYILGTYADIGVNACTTAEVRQLLAGLDL